jgi:hypothetical protein
MTKDEILKSFAELSPEEQEAIRKEIAGGETTGSPMEMCQQIMDKIQKGEEPMTVCKEMMQKCCN